VIERRHIRVMAPELAMKIAAGEVVERPSSAVKELLDNAVDAGASQISVEVREAGLKLLRVTDDGEGIAPEDLALAFTSHATSKIENLDDLEHLATLGFRGEALPSIAAVARVEVQTKTRDAPLGARFTVEYGEARDVGACASPGGVRITVSDLFGNVPARRKFVRSLRAEAGQIGAVLMQYALSQPGIRFTLSIDGRVTFRSPGNGKLADAVAAVHGPDVLADMIPVQLEEHGIGVNGLCSKPALTRANRSGLSVFVNGRTIQNRSLQFALEEAYSGFLMTGRHPLAAIHLTVPADEVDANIHPSKSEVRFARERAVHGVLYRAIANALLELRLRESGAGEQLEADAFAPVEDAVQPDLLPQNGSGEPLPEAQALLPRLPALRVFGQANSTFIIAEGPAGLYMIDQHAAHERVLYDLFDQQLSGGAVQSQVMLEPVSVPLTPDQMLALDENGDLLTEAGFALEPFGTDACLVRAIPALAGRGGPAELVGEVLNELLSAPNTGSARERALAAMACKAAVKAGATLDVKEMRELVAQLERTLRPATCPHGRPTMIHLSHTQLEREFGRR
jgi:DNA mismatch repair protein MutL